LKQALSGFELCREFANFDPIDHEDITYSRLASGEKA
jgi:hypothetical protein